MPKTSSFADISTESIIINDAKLSFSTLLTPKYEKQANTNAIKLLIPFYTDEKIINQININDFINIFAFPNSLKDVCYKELKNYVENNENSFD